MYFRIDFRVALDIDIDDDAEDSDEEEAYADEQAKDDFCCCRPEEERLANTTMVSYFGYCLTFVVKKWYYE